MRAVMDDRGRRYLLLKRSSTASLLLDPESGDRVTRPNGHLTEETTSLTPREEIMAVVRAHGTVGVRTLLSATSLCESDLHGTVHALEAAGELDRSTVAGERAYTLPDQD